MAERKKRVWRIKVRAKDGAELILVRATTEARAVAHAALKHFEVAEASHDDAAQLGASGGAIQEAVDQ